MRVLYVIPSMDGSGGAERSLAAVAPFMSPEVDLQIVTWSGADSLRLDLDRVGVPISNLASTSRLAIVRGLRDLIDDRRPDLVHTTLIDADILGRVASMSCRVPVVTSLVNDNHGFAVLVNGEGRMDKRGLAWSADIATARTVVRFHALTEHVASAMSRRLLVPRHRIEVIPRGRSSERLGVRTPQRRNTARTALGVDDDRPLVIAAARHEHQKGLDVLIRAVPALLRDLPSVKIVVGGRDGRATSALAGLVSELGLSESVSLIGQRDDVAELMCAADVWCVPSRWEGLGSILLEAMCLAVPIVASDIPAIREVAGDPPSFKLVPPGDSEGFARAITSVLADRDAAEQRAVHAKHRFAEHYDAEAIGRRMIYFYRNSIAASRWG